MDSHVSQNVFVDRSVFCQRGCVSVAALVTSRLPLCGQNEVYFLHLPLQQALPSAHGLVLVSSPLIDSAKASFSELLTKRLVCICVALQLLWRIE